MGSMGDSTRRRLGGLIQGAGGAGGNLCGTRAGFNPGASFGGYQGGAGGTFGKAARGLGFDQNPANAAAYVRPSSAGQMRPSANGGDKQSAYQQQQQRSSGGYSPGPGAEGRRERIRPQSAGVKAVWHETARELPRAPPHALTTGKVRPRNATMAKTTKPLAGIATTEYRLQGHELEPHKSSDMGGMGAASRGLAVTFGPPQSVGCKPMVGRDYRPPMDPVQRQLKNLRSIETHDCYAEGQLTEAHMAALEDAIRDAVRMKRSVYEGSKEMLLKLFKALDDGSGDVSLQEFVSVCAQVGVAVSIAEAQALFQRFGYDTVMPYQKFAYQLLTQPSRALAEDMPVRKGAFQAGASAHFNGKILYRHCRKPVYTPSDWNPALADRSADLPDARLVLEFVYGYQGKDATNQNLFYTSEGKVVYFTAGVGVVYQRPPIHHMYFFLGHCDDILSLALCPAPIDHEGKQYPAKTLVATGQVTSTEAGPYVSIWDTRTGSQPDGPAAASEVAHIKFDKDARGLTALAFSPSGTRLVVVATDNYHTCYVYDWRKQRVLASGRGQMGDPPQVYGVEWNPYEVTHNVPPAFVTFGRKHIKLWTSSNNSTEFTSKQLSFGAIPQQNINSAQWLPPRPGSNECLIVAGTGDGQLYVFKGGTAIKAIAAHQPGLKQIRADGHPAFNGVRGLRMVKSNKVLLSGGADGTILQWDVADGSIAESRFAGPSIQLNSPFGPTDKSKPSIRSLDYSPDFDRILVGTDNCDVIEVSNSTNETLMDGHAGDIYYVAFHPTQPHVFATVSDSGHIHLWNSNKRQMTHCAGMGFKPRAVAFSAAPVDGAFHVAVGSVKGDIKVLDADSALRPLHSCKDSKEGISDIKYSPNNKMMAAATFDTWIDIYSVEKGYQRVAKCSGHSAVVKGIDWSTDSSLIQSNSNDLELLLWNARTGKQVTMPMRNVDWASYTCLLGFPVMGIWPSEADGTEINALDRSKSKEYVVTSDDHGMVKIFAYPCVIDDAPHRAYRGHSSHVMCTRFNADDSLVCSVGGHDWAVFQFRVVKLLPDAALPPPPKLEWGPLDESGRTYGYTTAPAKLSTAEQPTRQHGFAAIQEEASMSMSDMPYTSALQQPPSVQLQDLSLSHQHS